MGLLFALETDRRRSDDQRLYLRTTKKRTSLAMGLLFGAALLATMHAAASPLFDLFWEQGAFWDRMVVIAIRGTIYAYPAIAVLCFLYDEIVVLERNSNQDGFRVERYKKLGPVRWSKKHGLLASLDSLGVQNWVESKNVAALIAERKQQPNQYATKGHWILYAAPEAGNQPIALERRAKRDDIDGLLAEIKSHFAPDATSPA